MMSLSYLLSIRYISPFHRAYTACFTVFSPFSTSKKSTAGDDLNKSGKDKVKKYVVSEEDLTILSTYKELVGDLHISARFKVPKKDPWPTAFHGYALGKVVSIINHHKDFNTLSVNSLTKLERLGLQEKHQNLKEFEGQQTFKLHTRRRTKNFDHVKEALLTYKNIRGDLLVPTNYSVPTNDPRYNSDLYGMQLGRVVRDIRIKNTYSKHREDLMAMGFSYESQIYSFEEIREALLAYKAKHGDLLVPGKFSIPVNDKHYAEHLWGMQLGNVVSHIRNNDTYSIHKAELLAMEFHYENINRPRNFEHVKEALLIYKSIHGNMLVPNRYIVPEDDPRYASYLYGMKLGIVVHHIRNDNSYSKHREELLAMGFSYENQIYSFEEIREALLAYKAEHGDLLVPGKYSIPVNDKHYAEHLWGMQLGYMVNSIRNNDTYSNHKAELLAMGFQYENINRPRNFEHVKEALLIYKSIHGNLLVPNKYIVPEDDPRYASHLYGMKLGWVARDIRIKNTYSKHREELLAMGFSYERRLYK